MNFFEFFNAKKILTGNNVTYVMPTNVIVGYALNRRLFIILRLSCKLYDF